MHYSSFEDGFRDMYPRLVRTLMVACGEKELAADLAQESLAKAYSQWKKVNDLDVPGAWVRKVAINALRDEMRKRSRRNTHSDSKIELSTLESIERSLPTPLAVDFARALEQLPSQQRIVATLALVDDCSSKEIAATMGISEGSVKTHLHHARNTLGTTLAPSS
ncbi:MAG TPA: RNA polymerase sigma factor [Acidimicrobiia bacterium]|nr:RNA polymerase sigma factor [Acidimicrobiia bacterium]